MEFISGHTSPETAFVVSDYPYGFRLRCKIRYWLEYKSGKGSRLVSQTTNPKRAGEFWNKPKASTYCHGIAVMTRDPANGYINWQEYTFSYTDVTGLTRALEAMRGHLSPEVIEETERFIRVKTSYESKVAGGLDYRQASAEAVIEDFKAHEC